MESQGRADLNRDTLCFCVSNPPFYRFGRSLGPSTLVGDPVRLGQLRRGTGPNGDHEKKRKNTEHLQEKRSDDRNPLASRSCGTGESGLGILHAILVVGIVSAGITIALMMFTASRRVRHQVELDRCSGKAGIEIRDRARSWINSYLRLNQARKAWIALTLSNPPLALQSTPAMKTYLQSESAIQRAYDWAWKSERVRFLSVACGKPETLAEYPDPDIPVFSGGMEDFLNDPIVRDPKTFFLEKRFTLDVKSRWNRKALHESQTEVGVSTESSTVAWSK